jgi:hypothetical protein
MREAFISDIHFGSMDQDLVAWELALHILRADPPDLIFLGGDVMDFLNVSRYMKDPTWNFTLQDELDIGIHQLTRLREACPNSTIWLLPGNHDSPRMQKAIWSKIPELAGLRNLEYASLLQLKDMNIKCLEEGKPIKIGELWHLHGHEVLKSSRVNPAKGLLDALQGSAICVKNLINFQLIL